MNYDLTTPDGRKEAVNDLIPYLIVGTFATVMYNCLSKVDPVKTQLTLTEKLVRAGKESEVDSLEIELDNKAGLNFKQKINDFPVETMLGTNGKMKLKVKYK